MRPYHILILKQGNINHYLASIAVAGVHIRSCVTGVVFDLQRLGNGKKQIWAYRKLTRIVHIRWLVSPKKNFYYE